MNYAEANIKEDLYVKTENSVGKRLFIMFIYIRGEALKIP